jgi:hypothetical protein
MSFRIAQPQGVRTAPAAHEGHRWPEGPVTPSSRRSWLAKQARVVGGRSLGAEGPSAATVARPNGYGLETRAWSRAMAKALPRCRPFGHLRPSQAASPANRQIRKRNDPREVPGRAGRVKEGPLRASQWMRVGRSSPARRHREAQRDANTCRCRTFRHRPDHHRSASPVT